MLGTTDTEGPDDGPIPGEPPIEPRLVSVDTAAAALGIHRRELYRRIGAGEVKSVQIGRRRLIAIEDLDAYVERLRTEAAA